MSLEFDVVRPLKGVLLSPKKERYRSLYSIDLIEKRRKSVENVSTQFSTEGPSCHWEILEEI